jgi:hypothetical protein
VPTAHLFVPSKSELERDRRKNFQTYKETVVNDRHSREAQRSNFYDSKGFHAVPVRPYGRSTDRLETGDGERTR